MYSFSLTSGVASEISRPRILSDSPFPYTSLIISVCPDSYELYLRSIVESDTELIGFMPSLFYTLQIFRLIVAPLSRVSPRPGASYISDSSGQVKVEVLADSHGRDRSASNHRSSNNGCHLEKSVVGDVIGIYESLLDVLCLYMDADGLDRPLAV